MTAENAEIQQRTYPCWCDDQDGCEGEASKPFGLCPTCIKFRHGTAPRFGMTEADLDEMMGYEVER